MADDILHGAPIRRAYNFPKRPPSLLECLGLLVENEKKRMAVDVLYAYEYRCNDCGRRFVHEVWNHQTLTIQEANERFKPKCECRR